MKQSLGTKTLLYPTPVLVVGTYDADGRANVMTAAWGGIACSKPPCVSVSLRAATASHGNSVARKAFTISLPSREQAAAADYFGLVSGRKLDKFAATGLTPVKAEFVDATSRPQQIAWFPSSSAAAEPGACHFARAGSREQPRALAAQQHPCLRPGCWLPRRWSA
jgi:flavin reductase (DIM6/NTAB) family NADH-FMN oxidoreductase RutF